MTDHRMLELLAIDCHRVGSTWDSFWQEHGERVCRAEPHSRERFQRLVRRLMSLVVSGNTDGQQAVGDDDAMPWELDDQPSPHDSKTQARCLLPLGPLPMGPSGAGGSESFPTGGSRIQPIVHPSAGG